VMTRTLARSRRELQVAHIPWNVAHSGPFGKKSNTPSVLQYSSAPSPGWRKSRPNRRS
jgi:hypothetical protein